MRQELSLEMDSVVAHEKLWLGMRPEIVVRFFFWATVFVLYRIWINGSLYTKTFRGEGKVVIITGATSGIGKETAFGLAQRGATVILASREKSKGIRVQNDIRADAENNNVHYMHLDLSSFASIRSFAKSFLEQYPKLDILINNAEIMAPRRRLTEDGLESTLGVNYFGHFLLTLLLADRLKTSAPSRVISMTHISHEWVNLRKDDLNSEKAFNRLQAFAQSKLANALFTKELALRLKFSGVTSNCVHPGIIHNDLTRYLSSLVPVLRPMFEVLTRLFLRSSTSGAQCAIYAALDFNLQNISGQYFRNCWLAKSGKNSRNLEDAKWLWNYSEKVTGVELHVEIDH